MKTFLALLLIFLPTICLAEFTFTGKLSQIHTGPQYQGRIFVKVQGAPLGEVSCSTNTNYSFAFDGINKDANDSTNEEGKIYLSLLLSALAAQQTVTLKSSDDCTTYHNVADLRNLSVMP
ncbi:hypothetical protein ACJJJB_04195 [Microbulbifer sp. ANSA001]|uniref:hypothetical protein n=1 Tax=Microbulbifer sp. ANSA001 TaxID=3243358 RepID=UPI0040423361